VEYTRLARLEPAGQFGPGSGPGSSTCTVSRRALRMNRLKRFTRSWALIPKGSALGRRIAEDEHAVDAEPGAPVSPGQLDHLMGIQSLVHRLELLRDGRLEADGQVVDACLAHGIEQFVVRARSSRI